MTVFHCAVSIYQWLQNLISKTNQPNNAEICSTSLFLLFYWRFCWK